MANTKPNNTFLGLSVGKVLQVVSTTKTDTFSTSSTSFVDITGFSAAITPASTANKVLVMVSLHSGNTSGSAKSGFLLKRDSTSICLGDAASSRTSASGWYASSDNSDIKSVTISYLDSPSSTSALTYKVQANSASANGHTINRSNWDADSASYPRLASTITLMEIEG
jgi:hypothetical protein